MQDEVVIKFLQFTLNTIVFHFSPTGVDPDEARKFVTSFYSSLAQNTERSHEPLDGKSLNSNLVLLDYLNFLLTRLVCTPMYSHGRGSSNSRWT